MSCVHLSWNGSQYWPDEDHTCGVQMLASPCSCSQFRAWLPAETPHFFEIHLTQPEVPGHKSPFALATLYCFASQWREKPVKALWTYFEKVIQNYRDIWAAQLTSALMGLTPKHQSELWVASLLWGQSLAPLKVTYPILPCRSPWTGENASCLFLFLPAKHW